jgi:glycine C-acetyltransferase
VNDHRTAIIPAIIGRDSLIGDMYQFLYNNGIFTVPVVYPAVPKNQSRFRFTMSSIHTIGDLDYILLVLGNMIKEFSLFEKVEVV